MDVYDVFCERLSEILVKHRLHPHSDDCIAKYEEFEVYLGFKEDILTLVYDALNETV